MCVFSLRAFRDAALVKDVTLVTLGEVPNKGSHKEPEGLDDGNMFMQSRPNWRACF